MVAELLQRRAGASSSVCLVAGQGGHPGRRDAGRRGRRRRKGVPARRASRARSPPGRRRRTSASWPAPAGGVPCPAGRRRVLRPPRRCGRGRGTIARRARAEPRTWSGRSISSSLRATAANRWWNRNQRRSRRAGPGTGWCARGRAGSRPTRSLPATKSHSGAENRSRIDIVTMNSRTSVRVHGQDLLGEVVADEAVAAAELPDELVRVVPAGQRQRGEVEARRPALGALHQLGHASRSASAHVAIASSSRASSAVKPRSAARISASRPRRAAGPAAGRDRRGC